MAEKIERKRLTAEQALHKSQECKDLASRVWNPEHRTELMKMAEAWEELARALAVAADSR